MPRLSRRKQQLQALRNIHDNLVIARYVELMKYTIDELLEEPDSEDESDSDNSLDDKRASQLQLPTHLAYHPDRPEMATPAFTEFIDAVRALHDKGQKSCVLDTRPKLICAPQLHLLPEWEMYAPEKFR
ncbi:hypothetical protein BDR06DRAFT_1001889 [Suillus hirtellus]|nr:hypothetical protein BDR06DRAFT_1001889 [Suillus hirtellus]